MEFDFAAWWVEWWPTMLRTTLIIVLGLIVGKVARSLTEKLLHKAQAVDDRLSLQRAQTITVFLKSVIRVVILGLIIVLILGEFGVEIGPIIAAAGVVGIAIGFGAQTLVQDFISGTFLLTEGYLRVGDVIEVNGKSGVIEDISLRLVVMRDFAGDVHVIPNGEIRTITNKSYKFSRAVIEVGVAYRENTDQIVAIMESVGNELAAEMKGSITAGPEIFGIDSFGDSAINWRVRFTTRPTEQWGIARAYRRKLKVAFDEAGIEIPFPHQTIYMGENHDGSAPFLHAKMYQAGGQAPEAHRDRPSSADAIKSAESRDVLSGKGAADEDEG
jgi:moderate conductance mechanosensitive channel